MKKFTMNSLTLSTSRLDTRSSSGSDRGPIARTSPLEADSARLQYPQECFCVRIGKHGWHMTLANFQHPAWMEGCRKAGVLGGPSNHAFAMSQKLSRLLPNPEQLQKSLHLTRSESDGLVNLS